MSKRPNKYVQGCAFASLDEAEEWCSRGYYVWWNGKPVNPGWARSWQWNMVSMMIKRGTLYRACINPERLKWAVARARKNIPLTAIQTQDHAL